ncbi:hypothetical protein ACFVZR_37030 [Streptomyces sp. NPDC058316]|uniref:hypothetical protein n=1 Tax=unclassified Streptomyces TaxID=2593676 RepID=UPI00332682FC
MTTYAIDRTPITDPRERNVCRALLVHALALHDSLDVQPTPSPINPAPDEQQLPPYSGEWTPCPKCDYDRALTRYRAAGEHSTRDRQTFRPSTKGERLERECERCDYAWDEALSPSPTADRGPVTPGRLAQALAEASKGYALDLSPGCADAMAEQLLEWLLIHERTPAAASVDEEVPA